jgi:phage tail-like protein
VGSVGRKGITTEVEPVEYLSSDDRDVILSKLPGKLTPPKIVLSGPMTQNLDIAAWHEAVRMGNIAAARKSCSLTMYDTAGAPVARYYLEKAWPSKLEISGLPTKNGEALTQTVTFVAEYLQRIAP